MTNLQHGERWDKINIPGRDVKKILNNEGGEPGDGSMKHAFK